MPKDIKGNSVPFHIKRLLQKRHTTFPLHNPNFPKKKVIFLQKHLLIYNYIYKLYNDAFPRLLMIILIVCGPELDILPAICSWGFSNDSFRDDAIAALMLLRKLWSRVHDKYDLKYTLLNEAGK